MDPLEYPCILLLPFVSGLIGYDCGGHGLNITTLSLLDVSDCELAEVHTITKKKYVQLLQLSDYDKTRIQQCKVEIDCIIFYCGMYSHISAVHNGCRVYHTRWRFLAANDCTRPTHSPWESDPRDHFRSRTEQHYDQQHQPRGITTEDGRCSGTQYSDPYGTWDEIVQATIRITLKNYEVPIERTTSQLILPSGQRCDVRRGECLDSENGQTFW